MIIAEFWVRHTRRHMPTRRVALGDLHLSGAPDTWVPLLGALGATFGPGLDDEQRDGLSALLTEARSGLRIPRVALRYRLQTDVHGLDRSRHRLLVEHGTVVAELDTHGDPVPQVLAAVLAAAGQEGEIRIRALRTLDEALRTGRVPRPVRIRRLRHGPPGTRPRLATPGVRAAGPDGEVVWVGVPAQHRWAMEVFGFRPGTPIEVTEVQRRFRRRARAAHPDHGGDHRSAAERLAELAEARAVLLDMLASRRRA